MKKNLKASRWYWYLKYTDWQSIILTTLIVIILFLIPSPIKTPILPPTIAKYIQYIILLIAWKLIRILISLLHSDKYFLFEKVSWDVLLKVMIYISSRSKREVAAVVTGSYLSPASMGSSLRVTSLFPDKNKKSIAFHTHTFSLTRLYISRQDLSTFQKVAVSKILIYNTRKRKLAVLTREEFENLPESKVKRGLRSVEIENLVPINKHTIILSPEIRQEFASIPIIKRRLFFDRYGPIKKM